MRGRALLCAIPAILVVLAGCTVGRESSLQDVPPENPCTTCHGSADNPAPPIDTRGRNAATLRGVGAHRGHIEANGIAAAVPCGTCHLVPAKVGDAGHTDSTLPAEVTFGGLAKGGGLEPVLFVEGEGDAAVLGCRTTYCHGASLEGGRAAAPLWNAADPTPYKACDACHGNPPKTTRGGAEHPQNPKCSDCHGEVVGDDGTIVDLLKHIDGNVQVSAMGCTSCHGTGDDPAPPKGTQGETAESTRPVGAHQAHLTARHGLARKVVCTECHKVPFAPSSPGHIDDTPGAEVNFGTLASHDSQDLSYDRATGACVNVYCHGATLAGGSVQAPVWSPPSDADIACTACHGNPPPAPHPQVAHCGTCHQPTATVDGGLADASTHIDGMLQVLSSTNCNACHGNADNPAPPVDIQGRTDTALPSVGAHQAHLKAASGLSAAVPCATCHVVPVKLDSAGHLDGVVEVGLTGLAAAGGATPSWSSADATCVNTYCHGTTLSGGSLTRPAWTKVDGTQAECGACHALPPADGHPVASNCEACHTETAGPGLTIVHPEKHIDGIVQTSGSCTSCHGNIDNPAPPVDTAGRSETTLVSVGAHQSHLKATSGLSSPVTCTACHPVPATVSSPMHDDGQTQLAFNGLATADGAAPAWDRGAARCAGTYCHGATLLTGGTNTTPTWTKVAQDQAKCGTCHGLPPAAPHPQSDRCGQCHTETIGADGGIAFPEKHIDGIVEVQMGQACTSCHGGPDGPQPPVDVSGGSDTTGVSVGAHRSHALGSPLFAAVACTECHAVPTSTSSPGHVDSPLPAEVSFGSIARTDGAAPAWNRVAATCVRSYCHGATLEGGTHTTPVWTNVGADEAACGSCHGLPPAAPHPVSTKCGQCHDTATMAGGIARPEQHVNGIVELSPMGCASCHGSADNPAPPVDTSDGTATTLVSIGAHQSHLKATSGLSSPVACTQCHRVPKSTEDAGHMDTALPAELAFGPLANGGSTTTAWDRGQATCTGSYCHGATLTGGTHTVPVWTKVGAGEAACGTCHGDPPPPPHVASDRCGLCHVETASVDGKIVHPEKHINGIVEVRNDTSCTACHGNVDNAAPPVDTAGGTSTALRSVGAHQSHLKAAGGLSVPVACGECHLVPTSVADASHIDTALPAEVAFGALAKSGGAAPAWNEGAATCTDSYCHGATLTGGSRTNPVWTAVGTGEAACGSCHGDPPPPPHVNSTKCGLCHETASAAGTIAKPEMHINGRVDVSLAPACNACHGNAGNDAPPVNTTGGSDPATRGVGAHQSHLTASRGLARAVACTSCHVVPATASDTGHADTPLPAEVVFSGLATSDGATPAFDGTALTCNGAYCHGATLGGGTHTTPRWTTTDGSQIVCGACHGSPPPAPHPQSETCAACHPDTVAADNSIAHPDKHIDGIVQVSFQNNCTTCHGNADNPAPPADTHKGMETTLRGVGAHQSHLKAASALADPLLCDECHLVPADATSPGHIDGTLPAEITWGRLSRTDGASPSWNTATLQCVNNYCHGATLSGGANTAPQWTGVGAGEAACGTCHGLPPAAPHPNSTKCSLCHTQTVSADNRIAHPDKHIDGTVEVNTNIACDTCHGNAENAAPPVDTTGGTLTSLRSVGAHQAHVKGARGIGAPIACGQCHVEPATVTTAGHADTPLPAEITWGSVATADGAAPSWNAAGLVCNNTYCHGGTLTGGTTTVPKWTTTDGSQVACGTCHGDPPPAPHPQSTNCAACHPQTANAQGGIGDPAKHVNGIVEVDPNPSCAACHGGTTNAAPPVDTTGGTATSLKGVGAHQAHLQATRGLSLQMACTECHKVPGTAGEAGHVDSALPAEITWGARSKLDGAAPAWNASGLTCTNTYCHGATLGGGTRTAPVWTTTDGSQVQCASCHGFPPPPPHVANTDCATCHPATATAQGGIAHPENHVDGVVQFDANMACNACHGSADNPAPPVDTTGGSDTGLRGVGAHQAHLKASRGIGAAVACEQCHLVPNALAGMGHVDTPLPAELTWGTLPKTDGADPAWDGLGLTCANTYCHGATLGGGTDTTPKWTTTDGSQVACGTCHGNPPPLPHAQSSNCAACHPQTADTLGGILDPTKHVNGIVEVVGTAACNACHGGTGNNAPPVDTAGSSATTSRGVGAHQAHLRAARGLSATLDCTDCHLKPATVPATGHVDSALPAELVFGAKSRLDGANPSWDGTGLKCTNTYCHGATISGGTTRAPVWTVVDGTQVACASCHGFPPPAPHPAKTDCATCHQTATVAGGIAKPAQHIDGVVQVDGTDACGACHGSATNDAPPVDTTGNSATTFRGVGAHQSHLLALRAVGKAVPCTECHRVPGIIQAAGHRDTALPAELTWGTLARTDGAVPAWDTVNLTCSNNYCHGATLSGGTDTTPKWTTTDGSQVACGACHGSPPGPAAPAGGQLLRLPLADGERAEPGFEPGEPRERHRRDDGDHGLQHVPRQRDQRRTAGGHARRHGDDRARRRSAPAPPAGTVQHLVAHRLHPVPRGAGDDAGHGPRGHGPTGRGGLRRAGEDRRPGTGLQHRELQLHQHVVPRRRPHHCGRLGQDPDLDHRRQQPGRLRHVPRSRDLGHDPAAPRRGRRLDLRHVPRHDHDQQHGLQGQDPARERRRQHRRPVGHAGLQRRVPRRDHGDVPREPGAARRHPGPFGDLQQVGGSAPESHDRRRQHLGGNGVQRVPPGPDGGPGRRHGDPPEQGGQRVVHDRHPVEEGDRNRVQPDRRNLHEVVLPRRMDGLGRPQRTEHGCIVDEHDAGRLHHHVPCVAAIDGPAPHRRRPHCGLRALPLHGGRRDGDRHPEHDRGEGAARQRQSGRGHAQFG
jgi:predicted CxxxxCH...CXXCH cytochrome family protein